VSGRLAYGARGGGPAGRGGAGFRALDPCLLAGLAARCPVPAETARPLAPLTSFRTGGPAALFASPADEGGLAALLGFADGEGLPVFLLGGGTNVVFDDLGLEGLVIRLSGAFRAVRPLGGGAGGPRAWAGAAAPLSAVADFARAAGRDGWARLRGIPGTLGGALVMNAGAHGAEAGGLAESVEVLSGGRILRLGRDECGFRYRGSDLAGLGAVLGAEILLGEAAGADAIARLERETLAARRGRLPALPSAGSVFRNPPGAAAGRLIEECGLKGARIGGALVSREHANVIVNAGGASSSEIRALASLARLEVLKRHGVELVPEIVFADREGEVYP
jgi:UDP-N-acetylmuramate dehydrogenase